MFMNNSIFTTIGLQSNSMRIMSNLASNSLNNKFLASGLKWERTIWVGSRGSYTGSATAKDGATLSGLAYLITGDASDWRELNLNENISNGQNVFVEPLLRKLELRVRSSVAEATKKFRATGFSSSLTVGVSSSKSASQSLNDYFSGKPSMSADCTVAASSVLDKGLLKVTGETLFNRIYTLPDGSIIPNRVEREDFIENMDVGDSATFPNYEDWRDYTNSEWAWNGENVVKTENDKYWGYDGTTVYTAKSKKEWEQTLQSEFKNLTNVERTNSIPGFSQKVYIRFFDVAEIAMKSFDLRRRRFR
jgi:Protein-glutamine gamma-glutamyltransferase